LLLELVLLLSGLPLSLPLHLLLLYLLLLYLLLLYLVLLLSGLLFSLPLRLLLCSLILRCLPPALPTLPARLLLPRIESLGHPLIAITLILGARPDGRTRDQRRA